MTSSQIAGFGHYVPTREIHNAQMEEWLQLPSGWIERRTGIRSRRWAAENEMLIDFAEQAGRMALTDAGMSTNDIAFTILATSTPDHLLPPTAPLLAHRLGLNQSAAFDLSGACTGFIYALTVADSLVRSHQKCVLIVAANILSRRINLTEPASAVLFGDAAGAVLLAPGGATHKGIQGFAFLTDGDSHDLISIPRQDHKMTMPDGQAVFSRAINLMTRCSGDAMQNAQVTVADIDRFIPHQANERISALLQQKLEISAEKTISVINEFGNSSAAGIPLALSIANQNKRFKSGETLLFAAAGAGMTGGAVIYIT